MERGDTNVNETVQQEKANATINHPRELMPVDAYLETDVDLLTEIGGSRKVSLSEDLESIFKRGSKKYLYQKKQVRILL